MAKSYLDFPKVRAEVGGVKLQSLYLALNDKDRQLGLMYIKELPSSHGVLFVFEKEEPLAFWMKNTFVPLSIGFYDSKGCLIEVLDMEPVRSILQTDIPRYKSSRPARYALEVQKGWFSKHKVKAGSGLRLTHPLSTAKSRDLEVLLSPKCLPAKDFAANWT